MAHEHDITRIRALLDRIDAVTAESKQLRQHIEQVRASAEMWPPRPASQPYGSGTGSSGDEQEAAAHRDRQRFTACSAANGENGRRGAADR